MQFRLDENEVEQLTVHDNAIRLRLEDHSSAIRVLIEQLTTVVHDLRSGNNGPAS